MKTISVKKRKAFNELKGSFDNFSDFFLQGNLKNKCFRMYYRDSNCDQRCFYIIIKSVIPVGDDYLIGFMEWDSNYENKCYPKMEFEYLNNISLSYEADEFIETEV